MKRIKIIFLAPVLLLVALNFCCGKPAKKIINIQPLGKVSPIYINWVKKSIQSFYGYKVIVLPNKKITKNMLSKVTKRVDANKALDNNPTSGHLLYLTEKDICYFKDKNRPEYGIFGLGLQPKRKKNENLEPAKTAIISTFRLKKEVSEQKILERLKKVALHEIGHNLGLSHCTNYKNCMMNAANGTIKQVDLMKVWFCEKCEKQIKR
jgi:archaemetzincin